MPQHTKPLSSVDAAWARMDDAGNAADVVVLMRFAGVVDRSELERLVASRILTRPRFSELVVELPQGLRRPRWVPAAGRVEDHLSCRPLPKPGSEAQLAELVSAFISTPFDPNQSPWRLCLVEGLAGGSALIAHVHHCLGDGFALIQVLLTMTEELATQELATQEPATQQGASALTGGDASRPPTPPSRPTKRPSKALAGLKALGHVLFLPFDRGTGLRGPLSGERRVAWSRGIALRTVREVARARGSTVNDVLLTALTGALRTHLRTAGNAGGVRAVIPVNLRSLLAPPEEDSGNYFGLVFVDLPVEESATHERFVSIKGQMDRLKASHEAFVTLQLLRLVGQAPLSLARLALRFFARKASFVVSNVPGPPRPLSLAGRQIRDLMFWVPHPQGLACGASILSYAGTIRVGIRTDAAVIAEPQRLADAFADELDAWLRLTDDVRHPHAPPASKPERPPIAR